MAQLRPPADQGPRYMSAEAAALYLGLSLTYVRRLTSERAIPVIRIGRRRVYDRLLLDRWAQRRAIFPRGWAP